MKIGGMNHPGKDPSAEITWFGQHGFDFVDLTLEPPAAAPDEIDTEAVKRVLAKYDLEVVAHTAWFIPLSSPFGTIRVASLQELKRALKTAHQIGASVMNTHYRSVPSHFPEEKVVQWHYETLAPLCEEAEKLGISIVLENIPDGGTNQLENIVSIIDRLPLLRFHLDSGHAKLERGYDRFDEYLEKLGDKLLHVHLSENDGTTDQHLPGSSSPQQDQLAGAYQKTKGHRVRRHHYPGNLCRRKGLSPDEPGAA